MDERQNAWAKLGTSVASAQTASQALETAHLGGWNLRKAPLYAQEGESLLPVAGRVGVVRDDTDGPRVLGDVGSTYHIIPNEAYCALLDSLVDQTGAVFETAGSFDNDRKVFVTMRLPDPYLVGGEDPVREYLAAVGSHDGSMSMSLLTTPVRVDCENVLNLAFQDRTGLVRVRHTSGARDAWDGEASRTLRAVKSYLREFHAVSARLARKKMSAGMFRNLVGEMFGLDEDAPTPTVTRTTAKVDQVVDLFENSPTNESIRGTVWAGLNALTEWFDHMSPTRGAEPYRARAVKSLLEPGFKNRALETLTGRAW